MICVWSPDKGGNGESGTLKLEWWDGERTYRLLALARVPILKQNHAMMGSLCTRDKAAIVDMLAGSA